MITRRRIPSNTDGAAGARVRFRTQTGSVYEVDKAGMTWRRLSATFASGPLRTDSGTLIRHPRVQFGQPVVLIGPPFGPGLGPRVIRTTRVVAIQTVVGTAGEASPVEVMAPVEFEFAGVSFRDVRVGERLTRRFSGGAFPDRFEVTHVDERFIYCGTPGSGWKFDRDLGIEVDEECAFGLEFGTVATWLVHPRREGQSDG